MGTRLFRTGWNLLAGGFLSLALACQAGLGAGSDDSWLYPLWVPTDVAVVDLDGDGRADVVTLATVKLFQGGAFEGQLQVYLQTAPGLFAPPDTYAVGSFPWRVYGVDLDGDGVRDLVFTDPDARKISWMRQDPQARGHFLPTEVIDSGLNAYELGVGDLNGDGVPDLAIPDATQGVTRMALRYQDPLHRGSFLPRGELATPGAPDNLVAGDIDGDGRTDLFTWIHTASSGYTANGLLGLSLQGADGKLGTFVNLATRTGLNVQRLALGDADGAGRRALLAYFTPSELGFRALLAALPQDSAGVFSAPVYTDVNALDGREDVVFADLNGDGRTDAALAGSFPVGSPSVMKSKLNLLMQSGSGALSLATTFELPFLASRLGAGDLDGDGRPDLVLLDSHDQAYVLMQSHSSPGSFEAPRTLR